MNPADLAAVATLIREQRLAALGTLHDGAPFVSMVAYAAEPDFSSFILHLSRLAPHVQNLLADSRASLLICEPDRGQPDIQTLARLTITGVIAPLPSFTREYESARAYYLARLPAATPLFGFPDFSLYSFVPHGARYVGGFARAFTLTGEGLRATAAIDVERLQRSINDTANET